LVGSLLAGGLVTRDVVSRGDDERPPAGLTTRVVDRAEFLGAWARSRRGTWVVRLAFTRRTVAGGQLDDEMRIAQRPPDRLVVGPLGAVTGRLGGSTVNCGLGATGVLRCGRGTPAPPYAEEVRGEVDALRSYLVGTSPLYRLQREGRCFVLSLRYRYPSPPYGDRARFCFDAATGAPTRREVYRPEGTDIQRAVEIRTRVVADDLEVPAA
jgi:hypothetical protein